VSIGRSPRQGTRESDTGTHEHPPSSPRRPQVLVELRAQLGHRPETLAGLGTKALSQRSPYPAGHAGRGGWRSLLSVNGALDEVDEVVVDERSVAGKGFEQRDAKTELIGLRVRADACEVLGGHVRRRASHAGGRQIPRVGLGLGVAQGLDQGLGGQHGGDAEIADLDAAVAPEQDVVGLEVAVHDARVVGCLEAPGRAQVHAHDLAPGTLVFLPHPQIDAVDTLHCDEDLPARLADVEDADHVGVR